MTVPGWYRNPLTPYGRGVVARKLGLPSDCSEVVFRQVVRGMQELKGLRVTGLVDEPTASALGEAYEWGNGGPAWWREGMSVGEVSVPVEAILRLQGRLGIRPSDLIDQATAWALVVDYGDVRVYAH